MWPVPHPPLQHLWQEVMEAAQLSRPKDAPTVAPDRNFTRTEAGIGGLLSGAGLGDVRVKTISWRHVVGLDDWWIGPANGIAALGLALRGQPDHVVRRARDEYERLAQRYVGRGGLLCLPTSALLASGRVG